MGGYYARHLTTDGGRRNYGVVVVANARVADASPIGHRIDRMDRRSKELHDDTNQNCTPHTLADPFPHGAPSNLDSG